MERCLLYHLYHLACKQAKLYITVYFYAKKILFSLNPDAITEYCEIEILKDNTNIVLFQFYIITVLIDT